MPELPEVESTARSLRPRLVGQQVSGISGIDWPRMVPNTSEAELDAALRGLRVVSVGRRGKYLLIELEDEHWLAVHRKMSGNLFLVRSEAPVELHTHFRLAFEGGDELRLLDVRKFGRIYLFPSAAELRGFLAQRLGPDSLLDLDEEVLAARLQGRTGRIKVLLLDQSFVAGIGNLYADEALWEAGLHPLRSASSLTSAEIRALAAAVRNVLTLGVERRGTSFSTYRDSDGRAGENQEFLNVYGRAGQSCPRCGTPISRILIGQRGSHFCPQCQTLARTGDR